MPSLLPGYEYDIFISYRQKDNKGDRWVTEFVNALKAELEATFKEDISIYFDENPHDGLLETHDVDDSLKDKLKCLIFIPIISQTFCDPKSFAWNDEFLAFLKIAAADAYGLKIRLPNGNTASRVVPIRIHELDTRDKKLVEEALQGPLRAIDFTYQSAGVNRPLRPKDDEASKAQHAYRDQINKAANAIKEIISGLQGSEEIVSPKEEDKSNIGRVPTGTRAARKWNFKIPDVKSLTLLASLVALIAVTTLHFSEAPPDNQSYSATILAPEGMNFNTLLGGHIALSPDGRSLAFVARDSLGKTALWVRPLKALSGRAFADTEGASFPFWSPDSRYIAFFAGGKLKKIEVSGGSPQTLCDAPSGRGGTWSEKGVIVFCPSSGSFSLSLVSSTGGVPVIITKLDSNQNEVSHRWPVFLPDGVHFLYSARTTSSSFGESDAAFVASVDTTFKPRFVTKSGSSVAYANGHLLYFYDQMLVAKAFDLNTFEPTGDAIPVAARMHFEPFTGKASFSVSRNGNLAYLTGTGSSEVQLRWHDRKSTITTTLGKNSIYTDIRFSPNGKWIAVSQRDAISGNNDIWLHEIKLNVWTRFTFDHGTDRWPIWSPNGDMIIFGSDRNKRFNLFQRAASGAGTEEVLLETNRPKYPSDWSSDGDFIAYHVENGGFQRDIWILPVSPKGASGKEKPFLFLQTKYDEARAAFSPDGRWIAYQSTETGRNEVYIRPFPGPGGKWQVSTRGGTRPRWRRDGKEIFFLNGDLIMAAEINLTSSVVQIGSSLELFQCNPFGGAAADIYDVSADGQRFIVTSVSGSDRASPVTLVVNWVGEIKKK